MYLPRWEVVKRRNVKNKWCRNLLKVSMHCLTKSRSQERQNVSFSKISWFTVNWKKVFFLRHWSVIAREQRSVQRPCARIGPTQFSVLYNPFTRFYSNSHACIYEENYISGVAWPKQLAFLTCGCILQGYLFACKGFLWMLCRLFMFENFFSFIKMFALMNILGT